MSLEDIFKMEYNMSQRFMAEPDFFEGVRANLIDKDNDPQWKYKTVDEVPDEEVQSYFTKFGKTAQLDVVKELKKLGISTRQA